MTGDDQAGERPKSKTVPTGKQAPAEAIAASAFPASRACPLAQLPHQVSLIADTPRPVLVLLAQEAAGAHTDDVRGVVMPPGPVFEEGPHQLAQALAVVAAKVAQGLHLQQAGPGVSGRGSREGGEKEARLKAEALGCQLQQGAGAKGCSPAACLPGGNPRICPLVQQGGCWRVCKRQRWMQIGWRGSLYRGGNRPVALAPAAPPAPARGTPPPHPPASPNNQV